MLLNKTSDKLRIFWALLLSLTLSGSAFAEVFCLTECNKETSDLNFLDEESKAESEKSEEGNNRKHNENAFEFSAEGEFESDLNEFYISRENSALLFLNFSSTYYPHINATVRAFSQQVLFKKASLLVLYHKFIFYDLILHWTNIV